MRGATATTVPLAVVVLPDWDEEEEEEEEPATMLTVLLGPEEVVVVEEEVNASDTPQMPP